MALKLVILDIDGVMTDGKKFYDKNGDVLCKQYNDKDFTAIKRFMATGIDVCFLSGDNWNKVITTLQGLTDLTSLPDSIWVKKT